MRSACLMAALVLLQPAAARTAAAEPVRYALAPPAVQVRFRAYGLGMIPITGDFTRFTGTLTIDRADPARCSLSLAAETASLQMPQRAMTEDAQGPDVLDVARFPRFELSGDCRGSKLEGTLLLHGVRRPVTMDVTLTDAAWEVSALIRRADWGITTRPLLAGPEVRIGVVAGLPR